MTFQIKLTADPARIEAWLASAKRGDTLVYARGTAGALGWFRNLRADVGVVAILTARLVAEGRVVCAQRRRGEDDYEYLMQRAHPASVAEEERADELARRRGWGKSGGAPR